MRPCSKPWRERAATSVNPIRPRSSNSGGPKAVTKRARQGDRDQEGNRSQHTPDCRCAKAGAKREAGLALARQGIAVLHGRCIGSAGRKSIGDARDRARSVDDRMHGDQEDRTGHRWKGHGNGDCENEPDAAADPRDKTGRKSEQRAAEQRPQHRRAAKLPGKIENIGH